MRGLVKQSGRTPWRAVSLGGERKVDFVDSRTRLGNAQTSLTLHLLLQKLKIFGIFN